MRALTIVLLLTVGAACSDDNGSSLLDGRPGDWQALEAGSWDGGHNPGDGAGSGDGAAGHEGGGPAGDGAAGDSTPPGPQVTGGACTNPTAPPLPPCKPATSSPLQTYCNTVNPSQVIMATCPSGGTQCEAHTACATGWHLCTGTEYLARGGKTVPPNSSIIRAWIGACGLDVTGTKLKDGVCSTCATTTINAPWAMLYECDTGNQIGPGMADNALGAVTSNICMRLIQNTPANGGYWSLYWASSGAGGSLCCLDQP